MQDRAFRCNLKGIKKTTLYTMYVMKRGYVRYDLVIFIVWG